MANKARDSFAVGIHLGEPVASHAQSAFVSGMHLALLAGAGAALLAAIVVVRLLGSRESDTQVGVVSSGVAAKPAPRPQDSSVVA